MDLISFQGLNCYQSCVISIAGHFGVDYPLAFSSLWSETDFLYEDYFQIYSSRRLPANLETLGLKISNIALESVSDWPDKIAGGAAAIVGVDAFHVPWSPIYRLAHDNHFFIIQKESTDTFLCFDPSYQEKGARLAAVELVAHVFDLRLTEPVKKQPLNIAHTQEAEAVVRYHPQARQRICEEIKTSRSREELLRLGRYIDTMIGNRYLYRHYLNTVPAARELFSDAYLDRWKCVKNGLFKAYLLKNSEKIIEEVVLRFQNLIDEEIEEAQDVIGRNQAFPTTAVGFGGK